MARVERALSLFGRKINNSFKKIFTMKNGFGEKFNGIKKKFYDNSSEFTKRSVSSVLLVFIYAIIIVFGDALFNVTLLVATCIAIKESVVVIIDRPESENKNQYINIAIFAICLMFGSLIVIRSLRQGIRITLWLFLVIATVDTSGYILGRKFGNSKILPNISPKKTIFGTLAGIVCGMLVSSFLYVVLRDYGNTTLKFTYFAFVTTMIIAAALAGDILQSIAKRTLGVKDMGFAIPGHGGIMDRMDSFLVAAPLLLFFLIFSGGVLF